MANPPDITQIPAPRVDFIDKRTGLMAREWYRFFVNIYDIAGGGNSSVSLDDVQVSPSGGASYDSIAEMMKTLQELEIQPPVVPSSGGTTYSVFTSTTNGLAPASGGGTTNFLRADGTWAAPGGGTAGNPTASLGLTAINGVAATYMRSDAAPALSVSIAPTWTATHNFTAATGMGVVSPTAVLHLKAGTATASTAPLKFNSGTNLTTAEAGAMEYDGVVSYFTNDASSGRGYRPAVQIFRLTASGAAIGPTIANFFGANSAVQLAAAGVYEIEAYCYFTKTTANTVTVTATTSLAPVNLNGSIQYGAGAGGTATGAANEINLFNSASTAANFGASVSLTTAVNHLFIIRLIVEANASASNLRINFTSATGTVTPLRGSYYKVTRLPAGNSGVFVA
jgi:hypothetical protein